MHWDVKFTNEQSLQQILKPFFISTWFVNTFYATTYCIEKQRWGSNFVWAFSTNTFWMKKTVSTKFRFFFLPLKNINLLQVAATVYVSKYSKRQYDAKCKNSFYNTCNINSIFCHSLHERWGRGYQKFGWLSFFSIWSKIRLEWDIQRFLWILGSIL